MPSVAPAGRSGPLRSRYAALVLIRMHLEPVERKHQLRLVVIARPSIVLSGMRRRTGKGCDGPVSP